MSGRSTRIGSVGCLILLLAAGGCSSVLGTGSVDPSRYASLGCVDLNEEMAAASKDISRTAITRGRIEQTNIPTWVPGGSRVASAVVDRQSARIARLQEQERAIASARRINCPR